VPQLPSFQRTTSWSRTTAPVGDGVTDNSGAIQSTINAAAAAGGGTVEIPSAGTLSTYLSGPITLSNSVNLQVDSGAMLQMLPRTNWPGTTTFISAGNGVHDIEISGREPLTAQGFGFDKLVAVPHAGHVVAAGLHQHPAEASNILIQGVTLQNPPTFHMVLKGGNAT
jgi:hypothetical protein